MIVKVLVVENIIYIHTYVHRYITPTTWALFAYSRLLEGKRKTLKKQSARRKKVHKNKKLLNEDKCHAFLLLASKVLSHLLNHKKEGYFAAFVDPTAPLSSQTRREGGTSEVNLPSHTLCNNICV